MDDHEPETGLSFERVVFFSDAVFAIVITLLVLELKVPHITEHTESSLRHALIELFPRMIGFVVSFLFVGLMWVEQFRRRGCSEALDLATRSGDRVVEERRRAGSRAAYRASFARCAFGLRNSDRAFVRECVGGADRFYSYPALRARARPDGKERLRQILDSREGNHHMLKKTILFVLLCAVTAVAQVAASKPYPIDNAHSNVGFSVPILGGLSQVRGKFTDFNITLNHDEKDITKSLVNVVIKATSIDTGIERRDNHLRNADFFDVEKFPEITFKSERIEKKGKQFIAHGPLTMRGVTKQIALPFTVNGTFKDPGNNKLSVGYSAKMVLNRRDFGINYSRQDNPTFIGDSITVEIELVTRALDAN